MSLAACTSVEVLPDPATALTNPFRELSAMCRNMACWYRLGLAIVPTIFLSKNADRFDSCSRLLAITGQIMRPKGHDFIKMHPARY
jgi:hypothetical protein